MSDTQTHPFALNEVFAHAMDGVFVLDHDRRFVMFNEACERITGRSANDLLGSQCRCHDVTACEDDYGRSLAGSLCPGLEVLNGTAPATRQRMRIQRTDGETLWVETAYTPIKDASGQVKCVLGVMRDISDSKQREDSLREIIGNLRDEVGHLREDIRQRYGFSNIIARSEGMQKVLEKIRAASMNNSPVLICGESGTGKEMVARAIHSVGTQKEGPFLVSTCVTPSQDRIDRELFGEAHTDPAGSGRKITGLLTAATEGTVFLGDVAALPEETQAKLLRAMQDQRVRPTGGTDEMATTARIIAAIDRDINAALRSGALRRDLYYRLNVIAIEIPPLRDRREDIPYLVGHMTEQYNNQSLRRITEVSERAWDLLLRYDWPGNVRELQNAIESAFAAGTGEILRVEDLPATVRGDTVRVRGDSGSSDLNLDGALRGLERQMIGRALRRAGSQRSLAAQLMGISRSRLYRRMDALGIDPNQEC